MTLTRFPKTSTAGTGTLMACAAMCCVQLGLAASVGLAGRLGPDGVAWLRLAWAAVIIVAVARPWKVSFDRATIGILVLLGVATAGMTLGFMFAVQTIPLGTASALEFLGPLSVAVAQGRGRARWWALVAAVGVLLLTEPWQGATDPLGVLCALGAAVCWAAYVLLTQKAGDAVSGISALGMSMPVAAVVASLAVGPAVLGNMDWQLLAIGFALALLLPVIPFSLELSALRRLTTAAFGTLMCLEPAIAVVVGLMLLHQVPRPAAVIGIGLVIAAGIGATRSGERVVPVDEPVAAAPLSPVAADRAS
ncbi:EamA family transporter [Paeniglutamicibacter cryotolerans]|uniref:Inner membrane transporter RhtA n=1 Tax=Paeniglutamicibacter cryotolerans TaxID=670079 RepID=A0A839QEI8_9MICC|nr:EamA family transporter [Paeniglutamicibacter cryotolerans]MBB2994678.1 inner membrane transporter RhtA [Paeniglutamicibacter cryotolerans]